MNKYQEKPFSRKTPQGGAGSYVGGPSCWQMRIYDILLSISTAILSAVAIELLTESEHTVEKGSEYFEVNAVKKMNKTLIRYHKTEMHLVWQVWEAGHYPQECSEAEASVGEMAGWSRTLEPEGPAEPDGVRWRGTLQKTQAAHQFHPTGHRSPELLLQEERFAHRTGNHRNCPRAELWQRGGSSVVLQPATDVEKHEQNQRVPGAAVREFHQMLSRCGRLNFQCSSTVSGGAEDTGLMEKMCVDCLRK